MPFSNSTGLLKKTTNLETNCFGVFGKYPNGILKRDMDSLFRKYFDSLDVADKNGRKYQSNVVKFNNYIEFYFDVVDYVCADEGYAMTIKPTPDYKKDAGIFLINHKYSIKPYITFQNFKGVRSAMDLNYFIIDIYE